MFLAQENPPEAIQLGRERPAAFIPRREPLQGIAPTHVANLDLDRQMGDFLGQLAQLTLTRQETGMHFILAAHIFHPLPTWLPRSPGAP